MPIPVLTHPHRQPFPAIPTLGLASLPADFPTRASPLPSDPTDNDEANALTVVALQRLALTKPLLLMLLPSLAMHVGQQPSMLLRRPLLMQPVLNFRSTLVGLRRDCATSPACSA